MSNNISINNQTRTIKVDLAKQGPPGVDGGGVPIGGITGQVLKKLSLIDLDVGWDTDETGVRFIQETEPVTGDEGDLWYNPTTRETKVRELSVWQPQAIDDGFF